MMSRFLSVIALLGFLCTSIAFAENPFLNAKSDEPVTAQFKGTEWNDEFEKQEYAWSARVTTTRIATAKWGAFFKITFDEVETKAPQKREIHPLYFFTTDNEVVLFNEENPEVLIPKLAAEETPPEFEPTDIYGLSKGTKNVAEGDTSSVKLAVKGDKSSYLWSHNSGHFTRVTWQRGVGLVEYGQGQGARKDGFSLKREDLAPAAKEPATKGTKKAAGTPAKKK
jgi:hypothetical protein